MPIYAVITAGGIVHSVKEVKEGFPIDSHPDYVELETYDSTLLGKYWTGSEFVVAVKTPEEAREALIQEEMSRINNDELRQRAIAYLEAQGRL